MSPGIGAVFWREMQEYLQLRGKEGQGLMISVALQFIFPILISFDSRSYWTAILVCLSFGAFLVMIVGMTLIPYSMAGERERHTLETVLATRLPGRSLYWGKLFAATVLGVGVAFVTMILQVILVTALFENHWSRLPIALVLVFAALLVAIPLSFLMGAFGLLVSARAATIQQAATKTALLFMPLMLVFFAAPLGGAFAGIFLFEATQVKDFVFLGGAFSVLAVAGLSLLLIWLGLRRFERHRLMLV